MGVCYAIVKISENKGNVVRGTFKKEKKKTANKTEKVPYQEKWNGEEEIEKKKMVFVARSGKGK